MHLILLLEQYYFKKIAHISRSLTDYKKKYRIITKGALILLWNIHKLHHYLFGKQFTLNVDQKPFSFIYNLRANLSPGIARLELELQAYKFVVSYRKVEKNMTNFLSRHVKQAHQSDHNI